MSFYESLKKRIDKEEAKKRLYVFNHYEGALVTNFFAKQKMPRKSGVFMNAYLKNFKWYDFFELFYESTNNQDCADIQPNMSTPWGEVLKRPCDEKDTKCEPCEPDEESKYSNTASFFCALKSIFGQLLYDIFRTILYTIIAIPSLFLGIRKLLYIYFMEKHGGEKTLKMDEAHEKYLGNVLLAPYFALAIIVDFLREMSAMFTRTYSSMPAFTPTLNAC